jgi:hypothetical protein
VASWFLNQWNSQNQAANAMNERNQNQALTQANALSGFDPTLSQQRIDQDTNTMLGAQTRFANYQPDFSGSQALLTQDRTAGLAQADALAAGGTAMQDRADQLAQVGRLEASARAAGDTRQVAADRATMLADLAEYQARSAGFGEDRILQVLDQAQGRERANNEQVVSATLQQLAAQGVQASPWMVAQIRTTLNAASQERLTATETALRMEDYKLRDGARQFALTTQTGVLESAGAREQAARNAQLSGTEAATGARETALSSTRDAQMQREMAGANLSQAVRNATQQGQQTLDQVREQLRATRDTAALSMLDSILQTGRTEQRANLSALSTQQQFVATLVTQILQNTDTQTMDAGTVAQMIAGLAR